ncbi:MAG: N-formylglutamate deformylase [Enterobacterales bacterium]|nr:N-formylglutamate deformylase [Enterobacterales bacterium]
MKTYELNHGDLPILVSMPHNGTLIPVNLQHRMTTSAKLVKDTDWYLDRLYQFTQTMGLSIIKPIYSRYVIDLNRPSDNQDLYPGQNTTELCPTTQFDLSPIYLQGQLPSQNEINQRVEQYWQPYHRALQHEIGRLVGEHGKCLLFEAHSIASLVPRFFDGQLADFNFGNNKGESSSSDLMQRIENFSTTPYSCVINGRFKGGFITRNYGVPESNIDAIQLELSQATYMHEDNLTYDQDKAERVQKRLSELFQLFKRYLDK